jgi:hypothetical protein
MAAYALLLRPAANRLYSKGAATLNTAELSVLDERVLNGALLAAAPKVIAGVEYVRFETRDVLTADDIAELSNLSSAFALFRIADTDETLFVPVALTPVAHLDDDLLTIQRYKGKTNEQFTKLLYNVTLAVSAHAGDWRGRRLRILDPVCGRGTSLNQGLVYGFDVDGVEIDRTAYDAYRTFLVTWLKDKRFKHQVRTMPLRRDGKIAGRRLEVVFARDKDEYKADDVQACPPRQRRHDPDRRALPQAGLRRGRGRPAVRSATRESGPSGHSHASPRSAPRRRARRLDRRDEARRGDGRVVERQGGRPRRPRRGARPARPRGVHRRRVRAVLPSRRPRDHARPRGRREARLARRERAR